MATNREEILADFQACTGIDDVAECFLHLEETNWNLLDAINRVMPQDTQTLPSEWQAVPSPIEILDEVMDTSEGPFPAAGDREDLRPESSSLTHSVSTSSDIIPEASCSTPRTRMLNFNVEFRDQSISLVISDQDTVATIKDVLHPETGLSPSKQRLYGWKQRYVSDKTKLSTLNLPKDTTLYLSSDEPPPNHVTNGDDSEQTERLNREYQLQITDESNSKEYSLKLSGTKSLREVRHDFFTVSDIPVRHQIWTGWPLAASDETVMLANSGINYPSHSFTVRAHVPLVESKNEKRRHTIDITSDSSAEEFEDANENFSLDDDMYAHEPSPKKLKPLMPEDSLDETEALNHFTEEFTNRYGDCHPMFFLGSLEDALKESCNRPARERKPLAVYLHHDGSVLTNVFCSQVLCAESLVSYLSNNCVTWAWDLTSESNKAGLLTAVTRNFGSVASSTIRNFQVEQLPILLVVMRNRSSNEVFSIMHGTSSLDELLTSLIQAVDVFSSQQTTDIKEEEEREARESVKREQDLAYEESLQADRAKEEAKRLEAAVLEAKMREEEMEREKEEKLKQEQLALKEAMRQSLELSLPEEPTESCSKPVTHIKIRLPSGETLERKFLASNKLSVLLDYLIVKDYSPEEYKVLSSWPRRDLTTVNASETFQDLKLVPQEMITLEKK